MKIIYILIIIGALNISMVKGQNEMISSDKLKEDFAVFKASLEEIHPNLYWYKSKSEMDIIFNNAEKQLDKSLSEIAFFNLLFSTVDSIHCGHSTVIFSKLTEQADSVNKFLPFNIRIFDGKLLVDKSLTCLSICEGSEIKSINGLPSSEILNTLYKYTTTDKGIFSKKIRATEITFSYLYALYIDRPDTFNLVIIDKKTQKIENIKIESIKWDKVNLNKTISDYLSKRIPIEFVISNKNTASLTLHSFEPRNFKKANVNFNDTISKIFTQINQKKITKLIIDLRDNRGGSLYCGYELFSFLTHNKKFKYFSDNSVTANFAESKISNSNYYDDKEIGKPDTSIQFVKQKTGRYSVNMFSDNDKDTNTITYDGKVYVIVNGQTFSSASLFASYCKANKPETILIGETPGGAYEGCSGGGPVAITLPNSKLKLFFFLVKLNLNVPDKNKHLAIPIDYKILNPLEDKLIYEFVEQN